MNTKFKAGDKVKVISMVDVDHVNTRYFSVGDIGVVINPNMDSGGGHYGYVIDVDFRNQGKEYLI